MKKKFTAKQLAAQKLFAKRAKAGTLRGKNPAARIRATKSGLRKKSVATGRAPSARLVKRRRKTAAMPKGVYANPKKRIVAFGVLDGAKEIAVFKSRTSAVEYGQALADKTGRQISVRKL